MPKTKKTATAEQSPVVEGARLIRVPRGDQNFPAAIYEGETPSAGDKIKIKLDNGVTYAGTVHDATSVDGEVMVEFRDGLTPVAAK
jgi:hypothetical protein